MYYPINEIFQTIQGEGYRTGIPSVFIRLQGCSVHCSWCDTKYTWKCSDENQISFEEVIKKNTSNNKWSYISAKEIIFVIQKKKWTANNIVITGGEPCVYNLLYLTKKLEKEGYQCQIETSGTELIKCSINTWITLSPKKNKKTLHQAILRANEIKYPILEKEDLTFLNQILLIIKNKKDYKISLQPISQNKKALDLCIKTCILNNWRLSIQLHKYILIP